MDTTPPASISPRFLILCLLLLTAGFRIVHLSADPPGDFDWSGGYFADEGYWSHNARNQVLFGDAVQDEWDGRVMSPLFTATQSLLFRWFGVGLVQVRIVGILSAMILALATFLLVRRLHDPGSAFLCAVLVSLNYPLLVLARQGILDPFAAALSWTALALACAATVPAAGLAGALMIGACTAKFFMVYAFVPVLVALALAPGQRIKLLFSFCAGALAAAALWFTLIYLPHRDLLLAYNHFYASQQAQNWALPEVLKNVALQPFYLYAVKSPALLLLANLALWFFLARPREANTVERAFWMWLLCGILFFALWRYRPLRYYTSLFVPMAALGGLFLLRLEGVADAMQAGRTRVWMILCLLVPAGQIAFVLVDRFAGLGTIPDQLGIRSFDAAAFVALSFVALVVLLFSPRNTKWIRVACVAGFLLCDLRNYAGWMANPQYSAMDISADLQSRIGEGVLSGQWAPELVLENRLKAVPVWKGFVNSKDPFRRYGITHLLLWRYPLGDEALKFKEWYPEEMKRFRKIASYTIKDSELELYQREDLP